MDGGHIDCATDLDVIHEIAHQVLGLAVHPLGNDNFFCQRCLGGIPRFQGSGILQGRFIAPVHRRRRLGILTVGAPADINVDILHTHPADFLNGLFPLDNPFLALGVMGDPVVVEVGNVHTDLQGRDGNAFDH